MRKLAECVVRVGQVGIGAIGCNQDFKHKGHRMKFNCWVGILFVMPIVAQASYVESCLIEGQVLQTVATKTVYVDFGEGEIEQSFLHVPIHVTSVRANGRVDSQCAAFHVGSTLTVDLTAPPRLELKRGAHIRVDYFKKTNSGMAEKEAYTLFLPQKYAE